MVTIEKILISLQGKDNFTPTVNSINKGVNSLEQQAKKAGLTLEQIGQARGFNNLHSNISQSTSRMGLLQSAASKVRNTLESFNNLQGLVGSVVSLYTIANLTNASMESGKSWNRIFANTNLLGQQQVGIQKNIKNEVFQTAQRWGVATGELKAGIDVITSKYNDMGKAMSYANGLAATSLLQNVSSQEIAEALFKADEGNLRTLKNKVLTIDQYNRYAADGVLTQEEINSILKENELRAQGLTDTDAARLQRMYNSIDKLKVSLGSLAAGPLGILADKVGWVADQFNSLDDNTKNLVGTVGLLGIGFVSLAPFLLPAFTMVKGMWNYFGDLPGRIRGLPKIDPESCGCPGDLTPGGSSSGKSKSPGVFERYLSYFLPAGETIGSAGAASLGLGIAQAAAIPAGIIAAGYGTLQSIWGVASGQVKPFQGYGQVYTGPTGIFGEGRIEGLQSFKFPTSDEILRDIDKKIPTLSWAIPTAQGIIDMVMNPKTPTVPWAIPGVDQVIQWVLGPKVPTLTWPTWGDIYNGLMGIFQSKIGSINISGVVSATSPIPTSTPTSTPSLGNLWNPLGIKLFSPLRIFPKTQTTLPNNIQELVFPQLDPDNFVNLSQKATSAGAGNGGGVTVHNYYDHVTIDARNLNPEELMRMMIQLNESV